MQLVTWDIAGGLPVVLDDGTARYVYGPSGLIAQKTATDDVYYLADGLSSTMAITDGAGDVVRDYTYDVYGQVTGGSGSTPNEFDFAGQQSDDSTGLQYLRARYYDPATGVFISRDPLAAGPGWLSNPHGYVDANPTNLVDPTGLCWGPGIICNKAKEAAGAVADAAKAVGSLGQQAGDQLASSLSSTIDALQRLASTASGALLNAISATLDAITNLASLIREKAKQVWNACSATGFTSWAGCTLEFLDAVAIATATIATASALVAACVLVPVTCIVLIPAALIVLGAGGFAFYGYYRVVTEHGDHIDPQSDVDGQVRSVRRSTPIRLEVRRPWISTHQIM